MNRNVMGMLLVAGAAALFGTLSYIGRGAAADGMGALPFATWRAIIGTLTLFVVGLVLGRRLGGRSRYPDVRVLSLERRRALLVVAIAGALLNISLFAAFLLGSVAVVLITYYTFPAIVTLAAVPLYGEHLSRTRVAALLLSSAGLAVVVLAPLAGDGGVAVDPLGIGLALFAALCQTTFVLVSGRGWSPMPDLHVSTWVLFGIIAVGAPLVVLAGAAGDMLLPFSQPQLWIWLLAGGVTGAAMPTAAFITGIGLIGPSRAAILMTVEPMVGVIIAALLLGEHPSALQVLGGVAVLVGAVALQVAPRTRASAVALEPEAGSAV